MGCASARPGAPLWWPPRLPGLGAATSRQSKSLSGGQQGESLGKAGTQAFLREAAALAQSRGPPPSDTRPPGCGWSPCNAPACRAWLPPPPRLWRGSEEALTRPPLRPLPCVGYPTLPQLLETLLEILQTDRPGAWQGPRGSQFSCSVLLLVRKLLRLGIPAPRWCPGHHQFCAWPSALRGHVADAQSARRGGQGACVGKVL